MKRETQIAMICPAPQQLLIRSSQRDKRRAVLTRVGGWFRRRATGTQLLHRGTLLGGVAFGGLSLATLFSSPVVSAADTPCDLYRPSCEQGLCDCGNCDSVPKCSCGQGRGPRQFHPNPIYQSLDTVAGGIERLFGLDRCSANHCGSNHCSSSHCAAGTCDGGCDANQWLAPMDEGPLFMDYSHRGVVPMPIPADAVPDAPDVVTPRSQPRIVQPRLPAVPPLVPVPKDSAPQESVSPELPAVQPKDLGVDTKPSLPLREPQPQVQPGIQPRDAAPTPPSMTTPRIVPAEAERLEPTPKLDPLATDILELPTDTEPGVPAPPTRLPMPKEIESNPPASKPQKEGSIFDSLEDLDDPFEEDARRLRRQYGAIRPTMPRPAASPASYRPVTAPPAMHRHGSQPRNQAVGSGLMPVHQAQPLRPVSHEEPIDLTPVGGRRVLPPYRPSR